MENVDVMIQLPEKKWLNYIGGKWVEGAGNRTIEVENPATEETIAEIARAEAVDVDRAVEVSRQAFESETVRNMSPRDRSEMMFRIARELEGLSEEIALAECLDNGKRLSDARHQAFASARYFSYYGGLADKLEGRSIPLGNRYVDYTVYEPYGVTVHIVPWNYPLQIAARSVSCAVATGNAVIVKSPAVSPLSVSLLGEACEKAGVPEGMVNILCGHGEDAGQALISHGDIDLIVFTGSLETGKRILHAASQNIIPCVMELGGKSAGIVYPDVDIENVTDDVIKGIFSNSGQICSAESRVIVHRDIYDAFISRLVEKVQKLSIGPGKDEHDITPLVSGGHLESVERHCRRAEEDGVALLAGGERVADIPGYFFKPTVFSTHDTGHPIACEEVFGPVLVVHPFTEAEEAVEIANGTPYGLVAGVYTDSLKKALWTAGRLNGGQVFVNEWYAGGVETPFGGTKRSGYGREKGQEALFNYVQTKNIAIRIGD